MIPDPAEELLHSASISCPWVGVVLVGGFWWQRRRLNIQKAMAASTNSAVPPTTPPMIAPRCDLLDDDALGAGTTAPDDSLKADVEVDGEVEGGVDVDCGAVEEEGLDTPKHETSVPFSTEKGNEDTVDPPAMVAKNWYLPCVTFTLGHVQLELDASRLDASRIYAVARFLDVAASVPGITEGNMARSKSAS